MLPPKDGIQNNMIAALTRYECKPVTKLSQEEVARWDELRAANPAFASPFFHPRFSQIMGETKGNVDVTVIHHGGEIVGFFPFTRDGKTAIAPGLNFSGYEGIIHKDGFDVNLSELLKQSGLKAWNFSKLVDSNPSFGPNLFGSGPSQLIDLTGGFEKYVADKKAAGSNKMKQSKQKYNRLVKDFGNVTFTPFANAQDDLDWMVKTKVNQLAEMKEFNFFANPWTAPALRTMMEEPDPTVFGGQLLKLSIDEKPVAVLYNINAGSSAHAFICTYDPSIYSHSPGLILDYLTLQHLSERGVTRLELGWGNARAKTSIATGFDTLHEGIYDQNPLSRLRKRAWCAGKEYVRQTPYAAPLRKLVRRLRNGSVAEASEASSSSEE